MNAVTPFLFEGEHLVRVVMRGHDPWFVASDVCRALGLGNPTRAVEPLDEDEKGLSSTQTPGGIQEVVTVSEGGLYTLVIRSRSATTPGSVAHRFRKWVTGEVLPAIRKAGSYALERGAPAEATPTTDETLNTRRLLVGEARQTFGVHAARELWFRMGLPVTPSMIRAPAQLPLFSFTAEPVEGPA